MMVYRTQKTKQKKKKRNKQTQIEQSSSEEEEQEEEGKQAKQEKEEGLSWQNLEERLKALQAFNAELEEKKEEAHPMAMEQQQQQQQQISEYNMSHHCSELIWCESSKQKKRYLNFLKLYEQTPKSMTMDELLTDSMLKYVDESYFEQNYKVQYIKHDVNAFCVLLWTSSDSHKYKKIPKGIDKEIRHSFQIHKYIQNSLIHDDNTALKLSMRVIRGINNMINNHPTEKQLIGYRGSKMSVKEWNKFEMGDTRRVAMYVACSMNKRIAELFIGRGHVLITIIIPQGCMNARVVPSPMSMFPHEVEILIPPYSLFQCVGKKESQRNQTIIRELVLLLSKDNKSEKFDGLKSVPYWTA